MVLKQVQGCQEQIAMTMMLVGIQMPLKLREMELIPIVMEMMMIDDVRK